MNIFDILRQDIIHAGNQLCNDMTLLEQTNVEVPKNPFNGDLATNVAMIIASKANTNPREIAIKFKELMIDIPYIAHIEIANPGFINFTIKSDKWHDFIHKILDDEKAFTNIDIGKNELVNIEFVSANPTGPMHIGHARGAVYGDALARLLSKCGYKVTREYYINDAGGQVETLVQSVFLRYQEALTKQQAKIPDGLYPGKYLIVVGQRLADKYDSELMAMTTDKRNVIIKEFVVQEMLESIKHDLKGLRVEHDVFFSEQTLYDGNQITDTVQKLQAAGLIYEGILPPPKGKVDTEWTERKQMLFKATAFGDDQDRPIKRQDGSWSYFASDIAYAQNKIDRGFKNLIYILGADHGGYVTRIKAVIQALGRGIVNSDIKICQLVNFIENGVPIKMSKRQGTFTTVKDVIDAVDVNIIRFMMLMRKNDIVLDFDLAKVKEQSKDNPVFYVQYAHVRTISIISNSKEQTPEAYKQFIDKQFNLSFLSSEEEIQLIKLLASWPQTLACAAKHFEPHRIAFYLLSVAATFHAIWHLGKENNDYRFVLEDNLELTAARLALVQSVQKIIASGLDIIGIEPLQKM